ncbi:MAG: hypothetical protein WBA76_16370 [Phormidesmis sp.]
MPRLSDRAFQIVKSEIERNYINDPENQIECVILLARLESLRIYQGEPLTPVEMWETISDILPNFNRRILRKAARANAKEDTQEPSFLWGVSLGISATAVLVATAIGFDSVADQPPSDSSEPDAETVEALKTTRTVETAKADQVAAVAAVDTGAQPQVLNVQQPISLNLGRAFSRARDQADRFETARSLGWQAALSSQNPPHSAQKWGETAALWKSAIEQLEQVSLQDKNYQQAQLKKTAYQHNLQEIKARQAAALKLEQAQAIAQKVAQTTPNGERSPRFSKQVSGQASGQVRKDPLEIAKQYGWQAALASQNAPHPPEKWADISRLWQTALLTLETIDTDYPSYAEAQQVKAQYQQNLSEIRDRYQQEQNATQQVQSLSATLIEMDNSITPDLTRYTQLESMMGKLKAIPAGTQAHVKAQAMRDKVARRMNEIAAHSTNKVMIYVSE